MLCLSFSDEQKLKIPEDFNKNVTSFSPKYLFNAVGHSSSSQASNSTYEFLKKRHLCKNACLSKVYCVMKILQPGMEPKQSIF